LATKGFCFVLARLLDVGFFFFSARFPALGFWSTSARLRISDFFFLPAVGWNRGSKTLSFLGGNASRQFLCRWLSPCFSNDHPHNGQSRQAGRAHDDMTIGARFVVPGFFRLTAR
jgi:hypothetical protein